MLDSVNMMFQILIDMYSGYAARCSVDTAAVVTLINLRQEQQDYLKDHNLAGKLTFMNIVYQIDDIMDNVLEEYDDAVRKEESNNEESGD